MISGLVQFPFGAVGPNSAEDQQDPKCCLGIILQGFRFSFEIFELWSKLKDGIFAKRRDYSSSLVSMV
jgi:hypothetical protein